MTDKDKMREEFEVWCRGRRSLSVFAADRTLAGTYASNEVRFAYEAWKAAKESSSKELADMEIVARNYRTRFLGSDKELEELRKSHRSLVTHHLKVDEELEAANQRIAELESPISITEIGSKSRQEYLSIIALLTSDKEALEKKLAMQQALFVDMGKHPDTPSLYAMYMRYRNFHNGSGTEELTKLLSASRQQGFEAGRKEEQGYRDIAVSEAETTKAYREGFEEGKQAMQPLSVTNILLRVVPDADGRGSEVYAKTVADVERELSRLASIVEDYDLGIRVNSEVVAAAKQAGRDELQLKLSEQAPYVFESEHRGALYYADGKRQRLMNDMVLIHRPLPPQVKGE